MGLLAMMDTKMVPWNIWETTNQLGTTKVESTVFLRVVPAHLLLLGGQEKLGLEYQMKLYAPST